MLLFLHHRVLQEDIFINFRSKEAPYSHFDISKVIESKGFFISLNLATNNQPIYYKKYTFEANLVGFVYTFFLAVSHFVELYDESCTYGGIDFIPGILCNIKTCQRDFSKY